MLFNLDSVGFYFELQIKIIYSITTTDYVSIFPMQEYSCIINIVTYLILMNSVYLSYRDASNLFIGAIKGSEFKYCTEIQFKFKFNQNNYT